VSELDLGLPIGVVVNPSSGKGKGVAVGAEVWKALEGQKTLDLSGGSYDEALANSRLAIANGRISALMVVGGDGMVHLGVNACANTEVPLAIVAAGTGNDSATVLGLPTHSTPEAVRAALEFASNPRSIDLIHGKTESNEFYSLGTVSAGFDALVNARANAMKWPKGPSRYQVAMVLELVKFRGLSYRALIDGTARNVEAMLCAVANSHSFGGGMMIAPHAKVDDGQLDLFIVHRIPRRTLLKIFPKVYSGGHVTHPAVEFVPATEVALDNGDGPVYSDGEYVGRSPVTVKIAPGALRVCAPQ
jgi:diacylglycerol kinase (ATP)